MHHTCITFASSLHPQVFQNLFPDNHLAQDFCKSRFALLEKAQEKVRSFADMEGAPCTLRTMMRDELLLINGPPGRVRLASSGFDFNLAGKLPSKPVRLSRPVSCKLAPRAARGAFFRDAGLAVDQGPNAVAPLAWQWGGNIGIAHMGGQ